MHEPVDAQEPGNIRVRRGLLLRDCAQAKPADCDAERSSSCLVDSFSRRVTAGRSFKWAVSPELMRRALRPSAGRCERNRSRELCIVVCVCVCVCVCVRVCVRAEDSAFLAGENCEHKEWEKTDGTESVW